MSECKLPIAHTDIIRWVECYTSKSGRLWNPFAPKAGRWRADELCVQKRVVRGYLHRAGDCDSKAGRLSFESQTLDCGNQGVLLQRDHGPRIRAPDDRVGRLRGVGRTVCEMTRDGTVTGGIRFRLSNYQGNLPEGVCRGVKMRCGLMPGVVRYSNAAIAITSVELLCRFQTDHFYRSCLGLAGQTAATAWDVVLSLAACTKTGA
jgi:hypothetical protein